MFAHRYLPWCLTVIASIAALWLAVINARQLERLSARDRPEAKCNDFRANLFKYNDLIGRSVKLSRLSRPTLTEEIYDRDVWPGTVELPGETCVGLEDMGIGGSTTHCFDGRTEKLTRAYYFPDGGPRQTLTYDNVDPRLVNAKTDTSYFLPGERSPWSLPRVIVPGGGSGSAPAGEDRDRGQ